MTNSTPPEPSQGQNSWNRLSSFIRRPSTLITGSVLIAISVAGYGGLRFFVYEKLPPLLATELGKFLKREVKVGAVESFSFNYIRLGKSSVPANFKDPDNLSIKAIEVGFNPLPLLIGQPLSFEVTLIDPKMYVEQDKTGKWIDFELPKEPVKKLPIDINTKIQLENGNIALLPQKVSQPVEIKLNGKGNYLYRRQDNQQIDYDLDASLFNSEITLKGNTVIETGKSQVELAVKKLELAELINLLPNSPIQVNNGQFKTNLSLNFPGWEKVRKTQGLGKVNLTELNAKITPLNAPLKANLKIGLEGTKILVEQGTINLGSLKTKIQGTANWEQGYNLNIDVQPILIPRLLKTLAITLPVKIDGEIQGKLKLNGLINEPNLTGVIDNPKPVQIEKTQIKEIKTQFQANFNQVTLQTFQIKPTLGGQIIGKGTLKTGILKAIKSHQPVDWQKAPLNFTFQSQLPTQKLISAYFNTPEKINLGILAAKGQIQGTLGKPIGSIQWQTPKPSQVSKIDVFGTGEIALDGQKFQVKNTNLQTESGKIILDGNGSFQSKQWQAYLTANSFSLTPFLPLVCQQITCPNLKDFEPLSLANANIKLTGRLDTFSASKLQGNGNLLFKTKTGTVAVNSQVSQGILTASVFASQLPLDSLRDYVSIPANFQLTKPLILETANLRFVSQLEKFSLNKINGVGNLLIKAEGGKIAINSQISQGVIQASALASQIYLNPLLANLTLPDKIKVTKPVLLETANLKLTSQLEKFSWNKIDGIANILLKSQGGKITVDSQLSQGEIQSSIFASQFPLNSLIANLPTPTKIAQTRINFSGNLSQLFQNSTLNINSLKATGNGQLIINNHPLTATANLNNGILSAIANTGQISLNQFVPKLSIPAKLINSNIQVSANLQKIINSLAKTPDFSSLNLTANLNLAVAQGRVKAITQLNQNQWQANIIATQINPAFIPNLKSLSPLSPLNGNLNLSGNINSLFQPNKHFLINANQITLQAKEQQLDAKGTISVSSLFTAPDIANINLEVQAKSKLDNIPLTQFVSLIPVKRSLLPKELKIAGIGEFKGNITGKNLLTTPLKTGNLQLNGNLKLINFAFNNRAFDTFLNGTIKASLGEIIALDLRGKNDIIAANFEPCKLSQCAFPYLPTSFEIRQNTGQYPIIAQGKLQGDRFLAKIENFPLELLNIFPGIDYGFRGTLAGIVKGNVDINLIKLTGNANLQIQEPNVGLIKFQEFTANINYQESIARINAATFLVGNSRYNLQGELNVKSGELQGNLNIRKARVQEVLTALQISNINSLVNFFQFKTPDVGTASQVQTESVGNVNASLKEQVNLLAIIDQKIREFARIQQAGNVPNELNILGLFDANISLNGTLKNPKLRFQLQGNNWAWYPQTPFVNIIRPLGLVKESTQVIPINEVQLQGSFENGFIQLQPAQIKIQDAVISLMGKFSPQQLSSHFTVNNLSFDTLNNFVRLPTDISGIINLNGTIVGSLKQPQIGGKIELIDPAVNARVINRTIGANFKYENNRLQLRTTNPSSLQAYLSIPYPTEPNKNDLVEVNIRLGTEELSLVSVLTQDQLNWLSGEGEIDFNATARLDLNQQFRLYDLAAKGKAILKDATFKSAVLPETLKINGEVTINNDLLTVQQLQGSFAQSQLAITGNLPLFEPLSPNNPQAANPLNVVINQGKLNLTGLYSGGIDAQVKITGSVLNPIIGGAVRLNQGVVYIPQTQGNNVQIASGFKRWLRVRRTQATIVPKLDNLQVILEGLAIEQPLLYRFEFGGNLALNGSLDNFNNIQPEGLIRVDRGFFNFLDTRFLINRRHNNLIGFQPIQGLINPNLDLQMRALVSELPQTRRQRDEQTNEIPDNSLNRLQRIDINLSLKGTLSQLLPNFGKDEAPFCRLAADTFQPPIPEKPRFTEEEVQRLSTCLQALSAKGTSDQELLGNPVIKLTSSPPRSQGQIVRLLGEQLFVLADALQGNNTSQLLQSGILQLAVPLVLQGALYDVENAISDGIGTADFRLFPFAETTYRVDKDAFVRLSYDYNFNEVKVQYETRF